jgi:pimeloyl-ACP methyl ester carboxylesterase
MSRLRGDRWFYRPTDLIYAHPEDFELTYEPVLFTSAGRQLHGWFFPAGADAKGTIVHCHGNAGNITGHFQYVAWMPASGWNVLCFDYRGFGQSEGSSSRPGTIADAHAAIDYVQSREDLEGTRVMLFGQSLGGAIAVVTAADRKDLCGVAVEGAFSDYRLEASFICRKSLLWWFGASIAGRLLIAPGCDPIDYVARIAPTPTFFITGTADSTCDYRQTLDLHRAACAPKSLWVINDGAHTTALTETDGEGQRRLDAFFNDCLRS